MADTMLLAPGQTYYAPNTTIPVAGTAAGNYATLQGLDWEGCKVEIPNKTAAGVKRGGTAVVAVIARNVSGITLMGGMAIKWKTGMISAGVPNRFRRFDGYSCVLGGQCDGIIDPELSTVRDGDLCLIYVHGPTLVRVPLTSAGFNSSGGGVAWADQDILMAQTGTVTGNTVGGTTADGGGHLCVWNATGGLTCSLTESTSVLPAMAANKVGRALSALTTGETTQTKRTLVDLIWLPVPD